MFSQDIAPAALFLAAKTEDQPKKLKHVLQVSLKELHYNYI